MKKILLMIVFSTLSFSQTYNMQIQIGVRDGVKVADYEKAMIQHNKAHATDLGAATTYQIINGPDAGDYIRMPKSIFTSADMIDAVFNEWQNHDPVPYDKFDGKMVEGRNGTVFYTLRPDLSYNPQVKTWKYLRQSKWNVRQGGQSSAESIFKLANEIRDELGSDEHFVCMVSNTGQPFNEYLFVSGHDTLSEALDQSAFLKLLGEMSKRMPDWESTWGQSAWNGISQVSVHRPDLSN